MTIEKERPIYKIEDLKLKYDRNKFTYMLIPRITADKPDGLYEIEMDPIPLNVNSYSFDIKTELDECALAFEGPYKSYINLGFGYLPLPAGYTIKRKLLYSKEKEMTLEEIEKALGHKIKIVSEHK